MSRPSVESTLFRARRRLSAEYDEIVTGERCRRTQRLIGTLALGESVGARDKRQLARHIAYCQPCRRHARRSGVESHGRDEVRRRVGLAAFLPFPFPFLRKRAAAADGTQFASGHASTVAQWSANVGSSLDPIIASWSKAVAAAATIALAGAGAGVATHHGSVGNALDGIGGVKTVPHQNAVLLGPATPSLRERPIARPAATAPAKPAAKKSDDEATTLLLYPSELPTLPPGPDPSSSDPTGIGNEGGNRRINAKVESGASTAATAQSTVAAVTALVDKLTGQDDEDDDGGNTAAVTGD